MPKFVVTNKHGSITFHPRNPEKGGIDITEVDLLDVEIRPKEVIVYGRFEKNQD